MQTEMEKLLLELLAWIYAGEDIGSCPAWEDSSLPELEKDLIEELILAKADAIVNAENDLPYNGDSGQIRMRI